MTKYNKTTIERIRKARDHIYGAVRNLRFGILEQDFSAELKDLDKIFKRLCETWNAETYGYVCESCGARIPQDKEKRLEDGDTILCETCYNRLEAPWRKNSSRE